MNTSNRAAEVLAEFESGVPADLGPRAFHDRDGRVANRPHNGDKVIDALTEQLDRPVEHIRTTWTNAIRMVLDASRSHDPQGATRVGGAR